MSPNPGSPGSALDEDGIDDHMDFEEISDEELEEEVKVKGLGDALGVDWASLVAESRPRNKLEKSGSAKKRWEYHKVLTRVGISLEMAGEALVNEILRANKESEQKEKIEERKSEVGNEDLSSSVDSAAETETPDVKVEVKVDIEEIKVPHPVAAIQVALREKAMVRNNLFTSAGPFRRALSARRDLAIRRHLCNLPLKDSTVDRPRTPNNELFNLAVQLAERSL